MNKLKKTIFFLLIVGTLHNTYSQNFSKRKINNLKTQVSQMVEDDKKATQVMVDKVFSFAELGFQEFETSKYLTSINKSTIPVRGGSPSDKKAKSM